MKKIFIKRTFLLMLAVIMIFTATACIDPSEDGSDVNMITVKMNILYPETYDSAADIPKNEKGYTLSVEESATVIQILEAYSQQENIEISVDKSDTVYVTSINGIEQGDSSGWIYTVNGDAADKGASEYIPSDGDVITWEFIEF